MNRKPLLALVMLACAYFPALSQTKTDDDVVRITTNLVQIDAVVTKNGKLVPNLKAEDFEIFEDGRRQTITSFAFISNVPAATTPRNADPAASRDPSIPAPPLKRDDPRRTLAIVVDDLGLSAESMSDVRRQLRKFVAEQMQPHDLVAIIRTGTEIGALQQFTNDKRLLSRAVDQLRWNVCSRIGINVLPPRQAGFPYGSINNGCAGHAYRSTLSAMKFILDAMAELPGRKSMMVLSDSLPTEDQILSDYQMASSYPQGEFFSRRMALQKIAEKAIRTSVVIYSIDTQGLQVTGITAADSFSGRVNDITRQMNDLMAHRSRVLFDRRAGGDMIARQTGGFQVRNSNDFQLGRVLEEQSGYYLIGYRPTDETFNRKFHRITAKVKRSGMTLRTRYGFYGYPEEDDVRRPQSRTNLALMSPFGAQDIDLEFASFFANDKVAGSIIRAFVYLNAKDLSFVKVNYNHEAKIELHGVIFGDNGVPVEQVRHNGVVSLPDKEYQKALSDGIRIRFDMPAKRPGSYQVRVAARDVESSRIGAAGQFVLVPDLKSRKLAVSGILVQSVNGTPETGSVETTIASPAVRRFVANSDLYLACVIYNALLDPATKRPNLTIESRLFRDAKRVFEYPEMAVDTTNQEDLARVFVTLKLRLGADLEPGQYYLQLAITDKAANVKKQQLVLQWVDFEIVK